MTKTSMSFAPKINVFLEYKEINIKKLCIEKSNCNGDKWHICTVRFCKVIDRKKIFIGI